MDTPWSAIRGAYLSGPFYTVWSDIKDQRNVDLQKAHSKGTGARSISVSICSGAGEGGAGNRKCPNVDLAQRFWLSRNSISMRPIWENDFGNRFREKLVQKETVCLKGRTSYPTDPSQLGKLYLRMFICVQRMRDRPQRCRASTDIRARRGVPAP